MHFRSLFAAALLAFTATVHADDPTSFEVGAIKFSRPNGWDWVPVNSPMRKAQLKITSADKSQSADITFFYFGAGGGGGVDANAKRWVAQFESKDGAAKIVPMEFDGAKVTVVSTEGTYRSGMPGGPVSTLPDQALLGAIIQNAAGDIFVKMTGPADLVKGKHEEFMDFIKAAAAAAKK